VGAADNGRGVAYLVLTPVVALVAAVAAVAIAGFAFLAFGVIIGGAILAFIIYIAIIAIGM